MTSSPVSQPLSNVKRRVHLKQRTHVLLRPRSNAHPRIQQSQPSRSALQPSKFPRVNRSKNGLRNTCPPTRLPDTAFSFSCSFSFFFFPAPFLILSSRICLPLPPSPTQDPRKHCQDFFQWNPLSHTSPCAQYSSIPHSDSPRWTWVRSQLLQLPVWPQPWPHPCPKARNISGLILGLPPWLVGTPEADSFCLILFPNSPSVSFPPISSSNKSVLHVKKKKLFLLATFCSLFLFHILPLYFVKYNYSMFLIFKISIFNSFWLIYRNMIILNILYNFELL